MYGGTPTPDCHAVNESVHDVLGEKRVRDRETGKDAANLLRDLTIATLTPSGLNEIAECPVVRRYRDAHRALFNLEIDQLLPAVRLEGDLREVEKGLN